MTDGQERAALAVVRSLGRAGHQVCVCSPSGRSLAGASRYCAGDMRLPDPLAAPGAFVAGLERVMRERRIDVLIPISDGALLAVLPEQARFSGVCIPFPSIDQFRRICDKETVLDAAKALSIAVPSQRKLVHPTVIPSLALGPADFPLVVKSARSVNDAAGVRIRSGARHVLDRTALDAVLSSYKPESYPLLLQRRIDGPGIGIFLLMWNGERLATFAHRRIREKPPSGGVSVYRESIPAAQDLVQRSVRLLNEFSWQGVAMIEYKVDRNDGTPYLMEINGRFWGSLQLAIDAGVDFPALLLAAARGQRVDPVLGYRSGVRSRWWWGDVDHLLTRLRSADEQLGLPSDAPPRWRAVVEFLKIWRPGDRTEVFRVSDPLPFARETIHWLLGHGL